mmetsp:Transcript_58984/g.116844  ORF Transcript_58984/g.116844 Transcript_58984/m.116844 type:complete len:139 (-) Transcript_58984:494-910(-)
MGKVGTKARKKKDGRTRQSVWHAVQANTIAPAEEEGLQSLHSAPDNPSPKLWSLPPLPVWSQPLWQRLLLTLVLCSSIPMQLNSSSTIESGGASHAFFGVGGGDQQQEASVAIDAAALASSANGMLNYHIISSSSSTC